MVSLYLNYKNCNIYNFHVLPFTYSATKIEFSYNTTWSYVKLKTYISVIIKTPICITSESMVRFIFSRQWNTTRNGVHSFGMLHDIQRQVHFRITVSMTLLERQITWFLYAGKLTWLLYAGKLTWLLYAGKLTWPFYLTDPSFGFFTLVN